MTDLEFETWSEFIWIKMGCCSGGSYRRWQNKGSRDRRTFLQYVDSYFLLWGLRVEMTYSVTRLTINATLISYIFLCIVFKLLLKALESIRYRQNVKALRKQFFVLPFPADQVPSCISCNLRLRITWNNQRCRESNDTGNVFNIILLKLNQVT
jgi:hypothetical protein